MRNTITLTAVLASMAFAAHAQTAETSPEGKLPEKPKLICRTVSTTGSRLGAKKICATAKEWAQRADEDTRTVNGWAKRTVSSSMQ